MKNITNEIKQIGKKALPYVLAGAIAVGSFGCNGENTKTHSGYVGEYKGYVLSNPEIYDTDGDGKVDVMVNPPRDSIQNLDFALETRGLKYKRAFVKEGYLAQYAGEDVELVPKDFFDEMFPVRENPNKK